VDADGLHLRAAERFVTTANRFEAEIRLMHEGRAVNGKSILDLVTLGAECGTQMVLEACGPDAASAARALADLDGVTHDLS
jgi:phosphotransferase system HPr (HPr) family protein